MKKHIGFLILAVSILVQSCKKDDTTIFTDSPNARATASLVAYQKILTDATAGWKGVLYPAGDTTKAFTFFFKFDNSNRVVMLSDFTDSFAYTKRESSYRLKALQNPALIFDTYSYLHVLSDPDPTASGNGGSVGLGLNSDFEFEFDSATTKVDAITLLGRQHNSILKLFKLNAVEAAIVTNTGIGGRLFSNINKYLTYFKRFTLGGVTYEMQVNTVARTVVFNWLDANGNLQSITVPFVFEIDGISFAKPFTLGSTTFTTFTTMTWDAVNLTLGFKLNGATPITLQQAVAPLKVDVLAAQKWYAQMALNFNDCWVADLAFHNAGVDDYCKFKSITGFTNLWYAGSAVFGGTNEGMITFTTGLAAPYTYSKIPFTVNAGIARFTLLSNLGTFTGTGAQAMAMTAARQIMYGGAVAGTSFQDWYFVQTTPDGLHFDMVRVGDAQAWISWRPR